MSKKLAGRFGTTVEPDSVRDRWDRYSTAHISKNTPITPINALEEGGVKGVYGVSANIEAVEGLSLLSRLSPIGVSSEAHVNVRYPHPFEVCLGGVRHAVQFWNGELLPGAEAGFDTETRLIVGREIPELALASASTGELTILIHQGQLADFLHLHQHVHLICHNVAFDFWVVHEHLRTHGHDDAVRAWWRRADEGRLHDTLLLDELIRLGRDGSTPFPRNLAVVAEEYAGVTDLNKNDPYRQRYGEIIGQDWRTVDSGFFTYAACDPIATLLTYRQQVVVATGLVQRYSSYLWADAIQRFGLLTEQIQVKAAIALEQCGRTGMHVDLSAMANLERRIAADIDAATRSIQTLPGTYDLFKRNKAAEIKRTKKAGLPSMNEKALQAVLETVVETNKHALPAGVPRTDENLLSTAGEHWSPYVAYSPFVKEWIALESAGKLRQFAQFHFERAQPHYSVLARSGRTRCSIPNLQQIPRDGGFRECFTASDNHVLLIIDYSFIELVTLAAICQQRYGFSRLADVIKNGIDPHCFTAASITGMTLESFMALKGTDSAQFKDLRQKAKALNFGIPGGLGVPRLQAYSRDTYGVSLTLEEATDWRAKVVQEVYPELALYLADCTMEVLAANLLCPVEELQYALDPRGEKPGWLPFVIRRVLAGEPKRDGSPYNPDFLDRIWSGLAISCRNPKWASQLQTREAGQLLTMLCDETAVMPTGRIRAGIGYTEARNTPFQGLAADGAKIACFKLLHAGYRLVAFIHDEFVIELPIGADHAAEAKRIETIVCESMFGVVNQSVPVSAGYALSTCWSKSAEKMFDEGGRLVPWSPKSKS